MPFHATSSTIKNLNDVDGSDYGSDFSPEDILLLDRVLIQVNSESVPPLAIVDKDDAAGHGRFAFVPRQWQANGQDDGKEVFSQSSLASSSQGLSKLVGATLSGPPSFNFTVESTYGSSVFDDEALESWEVWKDALPSTDSGVEPAQPIATIGVDTGLGTTLENALRSPVQEDAVKGISPLTRFRSPPKKPLSVTDLVSPAWCELQYYFTLSRYGRVRPTMAMKRGSEVHQKLEEEVFTKVQVPVQSREDSWALQLWNLITSLRTLRETGMTREMQVWGVLHSQVVTGVMDELRVGGVADEMALRNDAEDDLKITNDALSTDNGQHLSEAPERQQDQKVVFLTDTKTRASKSIPRGASLRGTIYQLMLYHTLLQDLVTHKTNFSKVFERYRVDPTKTFTDAFLQQMTDLEGPDLSSSRSNIATPATSASEGVAGSQTQSIDTPSSSFLRHMSNLEGGTPAPSVSAPSDSVLLGSQMSSISSLSPSQSFSQTNSQAPNGNADTNNYPHLSTQRVHSQQAPYTPGPLSPSSLFHRHNTLSSLVTLLTREVKLTFPHGSESLSPYLHACYRDKNTSEITGRRVFMYDEEVLSTYVASEISWWNGERETQGVQIEEAFKCNMCEFAPSCGWRAGLQEKAEARSRNKVTASTGVANQGFVAQTRQKRGTDENVPPSEEPSSSRVPGEWISETGSEALQQQQNGIEFGGGRKGQERSRSVI